MLYAQQASTLTRLTITEVTVNGDRVLLRLGRAPIELPERWPGWPCPC